MQLQPPTSRFLKEAIATFKSFAQAVEHEPQAVTPELENRVREAVAGVDVLEKQLLTRIVKNINWMVSWCAMVTVLAMVGSLASFSRWPFVVGVFGTVAIIAAAHMSLRRLVACSWAKEIRPLLVPVSKSETDICTDALALVSQSAWAAKLRDEILARHDEICVFHVEMMRTLKIAEAKEKEGEARRQSCAQLHGIAPPG